MRGLGYMALGMFLFSAVDTQAKFLTDSLDPIQIVWSRQLGLFIGVVVMIAMRGRSVLHSANPLLQMSRGVLATGSAVIFIIAITYVPLADAVAVTFVAPFFVTALGAIILREHVGIRRWSAIAVAFVGMLIVIRPGMGVFHPAMGLVVVAAFLFAMRQILSRLLSGSDGTATTVAYTAITSTLLLTLPLPFVWTMPSGGMEWTILVAISILAAFAEISVIRALELAQAVALAPIHYTLLIWGTFYGWAVFGQFPDSWTWIGAAVIVVTGIYTLNRERQLMRDAPG